MSKKLLMLLSALLSGLIAACSTFGFHKNGDQTHVMNTPASEPTESEAVASAPVVETTIIESQTATVTQESAQVSYNHNSVYFGFDKYDIKDEYQGLVKANSDYLASHTDAKVQIQGNTDDIGSVEYNLALGQRRADAVKKALIAGGATTSQIEAVSYGKLKPKALNSDEQSRSLNRRSDIVYKSGQPDGYMVQDNGLPMVKDSFYSGQVPEGVL